MNRPECGVLVIFPSSGMSRCCDCMPSACCSLLLRAVHRSSTALERIIRAHARTASRMIRGMLSLVLLAPAPARAEAVLDVSGSVVSVAPHLEVRVVLTNRGDRRAAPIEVVGELLGELRSARLAGGVGAGREGAVLLVFSPVSPRPGTHALTLLLEHPVEGPPDGAGNPPMASQLAWLLVALGPSPPPPVRLAAQPLRLDVKGDLAVRLESADGAPH